MQINNFTFKPVSLITREEPQQQRVELEFHSSQAGHIILKTRQGETQLPERNIAILSGKYHTFTLLPPPKNPTPTTIEICSLKGEKLFSTEYNWIPPRKWTFYVMLSSHTDIGLHNSQYLQRYNSANFIDKAIELIDKTADLPEENQYRYCMEGTWFWNNYAMERSQEAAKHIVENYIKPGKLGIAAGLAGNCTQIYGNEELCRSAYLRKSLKEEWDIDCETMTMIDNNGLSWALVEPYVKAGYKNIFWAPNPWNPIQSTIYTKDMNVMDGTFTPEACASGSRCDVRYDSALPMVFYWQAANQQSKLLVWTSTQYGHGGDEFGISKSYTGEKASLPFMEMKIINRLDKLEGKYPYDIWFLASYGDDEEPNLTRAERLQRWNSKWAWPRFKMTGNMDEPFNALRSRFDKDIPTLRGEITGGWYQLALCTPEILAQKFAADRALSAAEAVATFAAWQNTGYKYPQQAFQRAWYALLCNDEHSYGASGYQGRRVYETWMQHRAWIELAEKTAREEATNAIDSIANAVNCTEPSMLVFNPTLQAKIELLKYKDEKGCVKVKLHPLTPFCYELVPLSYFTAQKIQTTHTTTPPKIKNDFYRITFDKDGSISEISDVLRGDSLLEKESTGANKIIYTDDNHKTFYSPSNASFTIEKDIFGTKVIVHSTLEKLGADIVQTITLPNYRPIIEIDNRILHAKEMVNNNRYQRYIYVAFPFDIPNAKHRVMLNGCQADFGKDVTGHGTDTYMAARNALFIDNGKKGVVFHQLDTSLIEFDHIHTDKTDFGAGEESSKLFSYVANDWLQMHTPGGSHIDMQCRYHIESLNDDVNMKEWPLIFEDKETPCLTRIVAPHKGKLDESMCLLGNETTLLKLLTIKCADDKQGIIFRLQNPTNTTVKLPEAFAQLQQCSLDEAKSIPKNTTFAPYEIKTLRLPNISLQLRDEAPHFRNDGIPEAIGRLYSGLIDTPRAACGAEDGQLYLIWGQNPEQDVQSYELYRSQNKDFTPSQENFVAEVPRGQYCVALYEDTGLASHTAYYYKIRAVSTTGAKGTFCEAFCGITREM